MRRGKEKEILLHIVLLISLLAIDLETKYLFYNLKRGASREYIEPIINPGISFSIPVSASLLMIGTVAGLFLFSFFYYKNTFSRFALVFLMAGTLGNFFDRIFYDGVRDFIVMPEAFIYNFADVFLTISVVRILIDILLQKKYSDLHQDFR